MQRTPRENYENNVNLADILHVSYASPTAFGPHFVIHPCERSTAKIPLNENIQRAPTAGWLSSKFPVESEARTAQKKKDRVPSLGLQNMVTYTMDS